MISKQPSHAFFLKAQDRFLGTVATWLLWMLPMFVAVRINELLGFALINEQVMKLVFLGGGGLLLLWRASVTWLLLRSLNVYLLIFIGWGWCSFLWSIEPRLTFLRMLTLSGYVLVLAAFMVYDWSQDRFHAAMRATLLFIVLLSFAVWFMDPRFVTEVGEDISLKNSWKGVTLQKNVFGQIAACSTVFWLHSALTRESGRRWAMAGVLASLYGVVLSRSSTALLATVPTCGLLWLLLRSPPNLKRYMPFISGAFAMVMVIYAMAVLKVVPGLDLLLEPIAALTGKDQTFSGRSLIWDVIKRHIAFSPVVGTGFGAYWAGLEYKLSPSYEVARAIYIWPGQGHNGYLDVINDLGYVGLIILVGYMLTFMRDSLRLYRVDRAQGSLFLALFFMMAVGNLSQSIWFTSNIEFVIMMGATIALGRSIADVKLKAHYVAQQAAIFRQQHSAFVRR